MDADVTDPARFFAEHGWMVLRGVVAPDLVDELRDAAEALLPVSAAKALNLSEGVPQLTEPARRHPAFAVWLHQRRPFATAAIVLGVERVQLIQDSLLVKPPKSEAALAWHQDGTFYAFLEPLVTASIRLALDRCTEASGCLWVLDRSHHGGLVRRDGFGTARVEDTRSREMRARGLEDACPIELEPGDVSIHHACTFHASFANTTETPRRTLVAHVAGAASRVIRERMPAGVDDTWIPTTEGDRLDPRRFVLLPIEPA